MHVGLTPTGVASSFVMSPGFQLRGIDIVDAVVTTSGGVLRRYATLTHALGGGNNPSAFGNQALLFGQKSV